MHDDAALVACGDASLWIGSLRRQPAPGEETFKRPARHELGGLLDGVPRLEWAVDTHPHCEESYQPIRYREAGRVGELTFEFYNGALSTEQCLRLVRALQWAKRRDTQVLLVRSGRGSFCNGIHLNVIQAADHPGEEAWRNIQAIDDVCLEILTAPQLTVAGVAGNAGAGGVMLALAADVALARQGVVLNPHYQTMGLYGSEYWTYTLPRAVGGEMAARLCGDCLPIGARQAWRLGMVQDIGPRDPDAFGSWLLSTAAAAERTWPEHARRKQELDLGRLQQCRRAELDEMREDMLENRRQFAERCRNFVLKRPACGTPDRLVAGWARRTARLGVYWNAERLALRGVDSSKPRQECGGAFRHSGRHGGRAWTRRTAMRGVSKSVGLHRQPSGPATGRRAAEPGGPFLALPFPPSVFSVPGRRRGPLHPDAAAAQGVLLAGVPAAAQDHRHRAGLRF
ncbi:Probable polyketide biosynthesis enoyl-CoA hydratase pksH [Chromobacterium violaceum]|uniref:Probable polyketide biosynthesis enoyl-CoA hydratase pksH n=1 Tax=Chromobacterium violaceum TaxID=536 RepID=A0A3S5DLY2_CHRVL|nr:Probable polyketide biosynthesis enoyl-CoA hydratase pksH [Chromobacterium violaceum]